MLGKEPNKDFVVCMLHVTYLKMVQCVNTPDLDTKFGKKIILFAGTLFAV
jgi:hypothetical protein